MSEGFCALVLFIISPRISLTKLHVSNFILKQDDTTNQPLFLLRKGYACIVARLKMKSTFYVNVCICNEVATLFDRVTKIHPNSCLQRKCYTPNEKSCTPFL